ncbi:hypothetical protein PV375_02875 [Gulosibacter sp. GYB002]|uniref:hypothetical protein n=1 Tax=Gulosibacter sp. GYB002 TaxID=2994391 RepID=UPI002F9655A6
MIRGTEIHIADSLGVPGFSGDPVTFDFADGCLVEIEVTDKPIASGGFEREFELEISRRVDETGAPVEGQTPKCGFTVS